MRESTEMRFDGLMGGIGKKKIYGKKKNLKR